MVTDPDVKDNGLTKAQKVAGEQSLGCYLMEFNIQAEHRWKNRGRFRVEWRLRQVEQVGKPHPWQARHHIQKTGRGKQNRNYQNKVVMANRNEA